MPVVTLLALTAALSARAENWPRFRGPNGSGISPDKGFPAQWAAADWAWKIKLAGTGHSSPCVWGDHVFITSAVDEGRERVLQDIDAKTGAVRWSWQRPGAALPMHKLNSHASATCTTDGQRVYTLFGNGQEYWLHAHDFQGKLQWEINLGPSISKHGHGTATSPIVFEDLVILLNEQDTDGGFITAVESATGRARWKTERKVDKMTFATPIIVTVAGKPQLITSSATDGVMGLDARTGKFLWHAPLFSVRTCGSPISADGLIFAAEGDGGRGKTLLAVRPDGLGDVRQSHLAWSRDRSLPYVPTPLAHEGRLYLWNDNGIVSCVDAKTGREHWTERVDGADYSGSPIYVDGKIFCVSRGGDILALAATAQFKKLGQTPLGEGCHSTPAVSNGRLFIHGFEHLYCLKARD